PASSPIPPRIWKRSSAGQCSSTGRRPRGSSPWETASAEYFVTDPFNPYHIWLGIPPAEQPADHYRLLGVSRFESNEEVIANAADQRVRHIRSMQTGSRQAERSEEHTSELQSRLHLV